MKSNDKRSSNQGNQQRCRDEEGRFESCGNSNSSSNSSSKKSGGRGNGQQARNAEGRFTKK